MLKQILSIRSLRKCVDISLENLYVDIGQESLRAYIYPISSSTNQKAALIIDH